MKPTDARIVETYTLPSHGLIYDVEVNPDVSLSSMKTKHEMLRLSASENNNKVMADIIDDCIVGDMGISSYDLCLGDFQFLMYKLRVVTYGPDYELYGICPYCGAENFVAVNIDELEINEYEDNLLDDFELVLPVTQMGITLQLQTPRILDKVNRKVTEEKRRRKTSENSSLIYTIASSIAKVDGEEPNQFTLEEKIKDLPMRDTNVLLNRINDINSKIGVQIDIDTNCATCGRYFTVPFRINSTFFRPVD